MILVICELLFASAWRPSRETIGGWFVSDDRPKSF